ncbi:pitrilysin family protein [Massilia sp. TS11]|uniref:M16 family metallopeptidase n=1 Tax=Massilia sp. TS11 TaxID=2908003 RepID=UPI001EDC8060|nr:pitrilysin family protein [Massilia sp. TS11]MCG2586286.1 insulinase family protein [Massilia sp. TS11]
MKPLMLAVSLALLAGPLGAVAADTPLPAALPAYGKDKPIPAPKITRQTLANGLEVWVVPRQGLPRVDFVLAVRGAGFSADDATHPGFANMLAGLLNEGSAKHDSRALAELAQGMGGAIGASASHDGISVSANALASQAAPMMALLAEVARTPVFPAKEVALAKGNALQSLKVQEAQPGFRATRAMNKLMFGEHPYGAVDPSVESIQSVSEELLRAEHAKRFRPDRSLLVVSGRITPAEALKLAKAAFGDWQANGAAAPDAPAVQPAAKPAFVMLERPGSVQATLRIGAPGIAATAADYVPLRMASTILGGGFSSRVNMNLREEKGYTYGASAGTINYRLGGRMSGAADVRNEVAGAALGEFFKEYRRLGTELVSDAEMQMNRRYVAGTYLLTNQLQRAVANTLANNWLIGLPADFLGQYVPLVQKVTPEQVRAMGKKYFSPEAQSIVVVGDKAILEQLKTYGDFSIQPK